MITKDTYKKATLEQYQKEILEIWPQLRDRPALHTWARVVQHATTACEGMRRKNWSLVLEEIATTIVWWLAFIEKLNLLSKVSSHDEYDDDFVFGLPLSATEIIWKKYPGVCPVEFGLAVSDVEKVTWSKRPARSCTCMARKKEVEGRSQEEKARAKKLLRAFANKNKSSCPQGLDAVEKMFHGIFERAVYQSSLEDLFLHFIEEIGEVSEALADATTSSCLKQKEVDKDSLVEERKRKLYGIAEELADVFSWAVAIMTKIQALLVSFEKHFESRSVGESISVSQNGQRRSHHISLAGTIWQKYGLSNGRLLCDDCEKRPCKCIETRAQPLYKRALSKDKDRLRKLVKFSQGLTLD